MRRSQTWFLLLFLLAGLLLVRESRQPGGALAGVDRAFFDWLVANAGPGVRPSGEIPVTLVEIDDAVADTPGRLPLSPLDCGSFLHSVGKYDPAVVAIEPVLEFAGITAGTDQMLSEQVLGIGKLLLGVRLGDSAGNGREPGALPALVNPVVGTLGALPEFPEIVAAPEAHLLNLAAASGATNLPPPGAGPVRDVPLLFRCRGRVLPSFTLEELSLALRLAPSEITAVPGRDIRFGDRLRLQVNRFGRALLDAREFTRFVRLSLDDLPLLETGQAASPVRALAERMRHGVVVLGRTDRAMRTLHLSDGRLVSPAEVFAWAAASLQHAPATRRASLGWEAGVLAAFACTALAGWGRSRREAIFLSAAAMVLYLLFALSLFESSRLWLPLAMPLGLSLFNVVLVLVRPRQTQPGLPS